MNLRKNQEPPEPLQVIWPFFPLDRKLFGLDYTGLRYKKKIKIGYKGIYFYHQQRYSGERYEWVDIENRLWDKYEPLW